MLEFKNHAMKLTSVNIRREFAGKNAEAGRKASDLRLLVKGGNDILDRISPHLKGCFYKIDEEKSRQNPELVELALTKLLHPLLQTTFSYDLKTAGYTAIIDHAGNPESAIKLEECQVNDLKITTQEGGTVAISLRVQFHPEPGQLDPISDKLQQDVTVSLIPPEAKPVEPPRQDLIGDLEQKREARKNGTRLPGGCVRRRSC